MTLPGICKNHFLSGFLIVLIAFISASGQTPQGTVPYAESTRSSTSSSASSSSSGTSAPAANATGQPAAPTAAQAADPTAGMHKPYQAPGIDPRTGVPLYETIQEDWSSLQVGTSKLEPAPPLIAQVDEMENFTRTLVQLQWRPGDPMDLYVIMPKGVKNPPAVLYLFSYKDDTDRFKDNGWCERATREGVAAVGMVSALSGHRFQSRPLEQWFVSELQESLGSTVHDVKFILDYLAQRGDIDMSRIGMFGQASGGAIALLAAAADPRLKAVDVLDPWGDWPVWLAKSPIVKEDIHRTNFAQLDFLKKVENLDPVKWLPTLKSTHLRIQQVMGNVATPDECKAAIRNAAPKNAEVVRYDNVRDLAKTATEGHLFDWVKATVKDLPAAAGAGSVLSTQNDSQREESAQHETTSQLE